jgi:hemoglobin
MSSPPETPYALLGGSDKVRSIAEAFYDAMSEHEPLLARLHACDEAGKVAREPRDKFTLFFIGWLGGPQDYVAQHGHPRLRMRHAHVPVDPPMVAAWLRCMAIALDAHGVTGDLRGFLDARLGDLARHMQNRG